MSGAQLQHEADELDRAMLRVSSKMLGFAELLPRSKQRAVREAATQLAVARSLVREHMISSAGGLV